MNKEAASEKEAKIIELQKAQTANNENCHQEISSLKKDLDELRKVSRTSSGETEGLKEMVHVRDSSIAEKDAIITSLQKQVQDGRVELQK